LSAWLAPVFLIAGFVIGALRQPDSYDWVWQPISALASYEAHERWWMTAGFVGNGLCHLRTASKLPPSVGRRLLALAAVGVLIVAAFPQEPAPLWIMHDVGAGLAFLPFAIWPLFAIDGRTWATGTTAARAASGVMLGLLAWFLVTLYDVWALGVAERALAVAEALWPLVVLESTKRAARGLQ
jgi:hypothetical membrane protein